MVVLIFWQIYRWCFGIVDHQRHLFAYSSAIQPADLDVCKHLLGADYLCGIVWSNRRILLFVGYVVWVMVNRDGVTNVWHICIVPSITDELVNPEQFSTGLSIVTLSTCIAAFGPNIAGLLDYIDHAEPFLACKLFAGLAFVVAFFIMLALRLCMDRRFAVKL